MSRPGLYLRIGFLPLLSLTCGTAVAACDGCKKPAPSSPDSGSANEAGANTTSSSVGTVRVDGGATPNDRDASAVQSAASNSSDAGRSDATAKFWGDGGATCA